MGKIHVLDKNTIDQIAAGEVIEGPSAVVKELAENAVDAGANAVTVEIRDGGISLIRVTDNGSGIAEEDVRNAFLAHATSKIRDAADLSLVSSFGFRGEALASIAAVAEVEMLTKTAEEMSGTRYVINGGEEVEFAPAGTPEGTTFLIRNLFYNTPARQKFLKSPTTEGRYAQEVMEHMAISHPEVAFRLIMNGQTKLQTPGNGKLRDVLYYLYGKDIAGSLVELIDDGTDERVGISGFIAKPSQTRGNREYESYFINGRYVKDKILTRSIEDAFKPYLMQHRYPVTCLMIRVNPELVDVNVHPAKREVRFSDGEDLYKRVYNAIAYALRHRELIPDAAEERIPDRGSMVVRRPVVSQEAFEKDDPGYRAPKASASPVQPSRVAESSKGYQIPEIQMPEPFENRRTDEVRRTLKPMSFQETLSVNPATREVSHDFGKTEEPKAADAPKAAEEAAEVPKPQIMDIRAFKEIRIVGQVFDTYWIMEYDGKVYMIDQHAAHEKVMYEHFLKQLQDNKVTSQQLMPALVISLSPAQLEILEEIREELEKIGFDIRPFGGSEVAIEAVPTELYRMNEKELLTDILDQYAEEGRVTTTDTVLARLASMSCKAAVKGNTKLSFAEAQKLIEELMSLENPYNCPHGRPTMIFMTKGEVEKRFKRQI